MDCSLMSLKGQDRDDRYGRESVRSIALLEVITSKNSPSNLGLAIFKFKILKVS